MIEIVSCTLRCIKDAMLMLGPLREDLRVFKYGKVMEKRIAESSEIIHRIFLQALDDVKLHILPGMTVNKYDFVIESDGVLGIAGT